MNKPVLVFFFVVFTLGAITLFAPNTPEQYLQGLSDDRRIAIGKLQSMEGETGLFVPRAAIYGTEFTVLRCHFFGCLETQIQFRKGRELPGGYIQIHNPSESISSSDYVLVRSILSLGRR